VDDYELRTLLATILHKLTELTRKVDAVATSQAQLDAYIESVLVPAYAALEAQGTQILAAVNALVAAYQANPQEDLTPQLSELQTLAGKMSTDQTQAGQFLTQLQSETPPNASSGAGGTATQSVAASARVTAAGNPAGVSATSPGQPGAAGSGGTTVGSE
jgi:hypothetical protein